MSGHAPPKRRDRRLVRERRPKGAYDRFGACGAARNDMPQLGNAVFLRHGSNLFMMLRRSADNDLLHKAAFFEGFERIDKHWLAAEQSERLVHAAHALTASGRRNKHREKLLRLGKRRIFVFPDNGHILPHFPIKIFLFFTIISHLRPRLVTKLLTIDRSSSYCRFFLLIFSAKRENRIFMGFFGNPTSKLTFEIFFIYKIFKK